MHSAQTYFYLPSQIIRSMQKLINWQKLLNNIKLENKSISLSLWSTWIMQNTVISNSRKSGNIFHPMKRCKCIDYMSCRSQFFYFFLLEAICQQCSIILFMVMINPCMKLMPSDDGLTRKGQGHRCRAMREILCQNCWHGTFLRELVKIRQGKGGPVGG